MFRPVGWCQRVLMLTALVSSNLSIRAAFFESRVYEINEDQKKLVVPLNRSSSQGSARLDLETVQHNAYANIHFKPVKDRITFSSGQLDSSVTIEVFDNPHVDGSKVFYLKAVDPDSLKEDTVKIVIHDNERPLAVDKSFRPPNFVNRIYAELSDGKMLASMNQGLVKLNQDGSLDKEFDFEFDPEPGSESWQYISHVIPLADGNLLIAVEVEQFSSGNPNFRTMLWKADANGIRDQSFRVVTSRISFLDEVVVLPDGSILLAGAFENFNTGSFWYRLQKYTPDGKLDSSFEGDDLFERNTGGVIDVEMWDEESMVLVGRFPSIGGYAHHGVAKMDFNGVVDPDFSLGLPEGAQVNRIRKLPDDSFIIGGSWLSAEAGQERHIARYFPDGTEDPSFHLHSMDFDELVTDIRIDATHRHLYVLGQFSQYQDIPVARLVRLNLDHGTLDPLWSYPDREQGISGSLFLTRAGMLYAGGQRLFTDSRNRLGIQMFNASGSVWEEGDGAVSMRVERLGASHAPMTVQLDYTDASGAPFTALLSGPDQVTMDAFQTTLEWPLQIKNDPLVTGNRILQIHANLVAETDFGYELDETSVAVIDKETPNMIDRSYLPEGLSLHSDRYNPSFYQPKDAILLKDGGLLILAEGYSLDGVIKLDSNGKRDADFRIISDAHSSLYLSTAMQQPDGKILLGGYGQRSSGVRRPVLMRVDPGTGQQDASFEWNEILAAVSYGEGISAIALQQTPDGFKILIGGNVRSSGGRGLVRLHMNGSIDESFNVGRGFEGQYDTFEIHVIRVMPEEKGLLIGGHFAKFNRTPVDSLVMLSNEGALTESFQPNLGQVYRVSDIELTNEGEIIVAGDFPDQDSDILKLDDRGVVSTAFQGPSTDREILGLELLPDGGLLVCGNFSTMDDASRRGIARLLPNGAQDGSFMVGLRQGGGVNRMLMPDQDTLFLVGGMSQLDRVPVRGIVKIDLQADPNRPGFSLGSFQRFLQLNEASTDVSASTEIHRLGASDLSFEVPYVVSNGSAALGSDFRIDSETVFMEPEQMSQSFQVSAIDDGLLETQENVEIIFDPQSGFPLQESVKVTVRDNEIPSVLDDTFQPIAMHSSSIHQMLRLRDDHIAVGGWVSLIGTPSNFRTGMVIAKPEGGLDETFRWPDALSVTVNTFVETEHGLLVGGSFSGDILDAVGEPHSVSNLVHLSRHGEVLDLELGSCRGGAVSTIVKDSLERFVLGGNFTNIRGQRVANIARLNADGSVDPDFDIVSRPNARVSQIGFQQDGRILIAGGFSQVNRVDSGPVARLNEDGSFDESFHSDLTGHVEEMVVLSDDRILLGGDMSLPGVIDYAGILLLKPDGTLDTSFNAPEGVRSVRHVLGLPNGELLVAGGFNELDGQPSMGLFQLNLAGHPVPSPLWPSLLGSSGVDVRDVIPLDETTFLMGGGFSQLGTFPRYGVAQLRLESPSQTTFYLERSPVSISEGRSDGSFVLRRTGNVEQESSVTYSLHPHWCCGIENSLPLPKTRYS